VQDSSTSGNILNDPRYTPIGTGNRQQYGMQASGGSDKLQFYVSREAERENGVYQMPALEQERLKKERGVSCVRSHRSGVRGRCSISIAPLMRRRLLLV